MNIDAVRERLCCALRTADTLTELRTCVAEIASELEGERTPDTVREFGAPWDGDCAPSTPRLSELGEEYGP